MRILLSVQQCIILLGGLQVSAMSELRVLDGPGTTAPILAVLTTISPAAFGR